MNLEKKFEFFYYFNILKKEPKKNLCPKVCFYIVLEIKTKKPILKKKYKYFQERNSFYAIIFN